MAMYFGRRKIFTATEYITAENVLSEVNNALSVHGENLSEIDSLYWYRRGMQNVLERKKEVRPEICSKVVVNNADMVVTFKNGYFLTKPATYVSRREDESVTEKVKDLNEYVYLSGKNEADNALVDWFHTVGIASLYIEPNDDEDSPFKCYALDPRQAFVVYSLRPGNKPKMGINIVISDNRLYADVYTETNVFRLAGRPIANDEIRYGLNPSMTVETIVSVEPNVVGKIPIVEYTYNSLRMSSFEGAIPIMDAINETESNRQDGISQFIQSLMILYNCELAEGTTANDIRKEGFIQLKNVDDNKADVKILSEQLDQTQTQTTLDDLYEQMLDKCAMPSITRNEGGTSDTGSAVYLRNGYHQADTAARCTSDLFRESNALATDIILTILRKRNGFDLKLSDIELFIEQTSVSNLLVKTQAAINMRELGFSPQMALERSGLSNDPVSDVAKCKEYIDAKWKIVEENPVSEVPVNGDAESTLNSDTLKNPIDAVSTDRE